MYNVNVKNTFGPGTQAIAISQYGSHVGLYACGFYGYQDTLYANEGTQVYLRGYIEVKKTVPFAKYDPTELLFNREQLILSSEGEHLHITVEIPLRSKALDVSLRVGASQMTEEAVSNQWLYFALHNLTD
jgi:hypothetical protein